jgi:uncharacterized protein with HEPN domain
VLVEYVPGRKGLAFVELREDPRPGHAAVMSPERDERVYLRDILNAIDRALGYIVEGRDTFFRDPKTQDAVIHNISVMGEAIRGVSESTRQAHPEIPWSKITATGDRVIHGHFRVDLEVVWDFVATDLPRLRHQVAELLPVIKTLEP